MKTAVVVTSISAPNRALKEIALGCAKHNYEFIVIGDQASPSNFQLDGAAFYDLSAQHSLTYQFAHCCPTKNYARKNIGYLVAIRQGAEVILETDDDNIPVEGFWEPREISQNISRVIGQGWVNVYAYFTSLPVWPRGFPLDAKRGPEYEYLDSAPVTCPIQQGMADGNPDVDAIYRLTGRLPITFLKERKVVLGRGSWCPFNSQNTAWFPSAFPLLYLPAYCSIRMTDIWRSFIAQRICWENGWGVLFHGPTVYQDRNEHDLMKDFEDEIPGYLNNRKIAEHLDGLSLRIGVIHLGDNLRRCYAELIQMGLVGGAEIPLLNAWLEDIKC